VEQLRGFEVDQEVQTMFLRLLRVRVNPDKLSGLQRKYGELVIPELHKVPGCLYAGLVQSLEDASDGISLTMWVDQSHAIAYEQSGKYAELVEATREYFADSSEWTLQLTQNLELEYRPLPSDPIVTSYDADLQEGEPQQIARKHTAPMYLRIVSMHIQPEKLAEFVKVYNGEVIPALRKVDGCQNAYLAGGIREKSEVLSITIWDTLEHARVYELSGEFDKLKQKIKHTFSQLALWKMGLDDSQPLGTLDTGPKAVTSDDVAVRTYSIVVSQAF
jgi:heme-degrading monooxygenase HmoA